MSKLDELIKAKQNKQDELDKVTQNYRDRVRELLLSVKEEYGPLIREGNIKRKQSIKEINDYTLKMVSNSKFIINFIAPVISRLLTNILGEEFVYEYIVHEDYRKMQSIFGFYNEKIATKSLVIAPLSIVQHITFINNRDFNNLVNSGKFLLIQEDALDMLRRYTLNFYEQNHGNYPNIKLVPDKRFRCDIYPCIKEFIDYVIDYALENEIATYNFSEDNLNELLDNYLALNLNKEDNIARTLNKN